MTNDNAIRLVIADDHPLIRAGFRMTFRNVPGFEFVGEADDGKRALDLVAELRPDVLLTDITMPLINGIAVTERVTKEYPTVRVIILSTFANEEFVGQAVRAGASGYLLKDADALEIEFAIRAVMRGESYLSPAISKCVMESYMRVTSRNTPAVDNPLTPRQRQILQLVAEGLSTKEIARQLNISAKTVETHRTDVTHKLGIHDIPGLVRYAMRQGLIPNETCQVASANASSRAVPSVEESDLAAR